MIHLHEEFSTLSGDQISAAIQNLVIYIYHISKKLLKRRNVLRRFIFCRSALSLFRRGGDGGEEYLPECSPELPEAVSPESSAVQSGLRQVAEGLGVAGCFRFSEGSTRKREL